MDERDLIKERFKVAISSAVKVISEELSLEIKFGNNINEKKDLLNLPEVANLSSLQDFTNLRALADSEALKIKHTSKKIYAETGGLSGAPLRDRSTEVIAHIFKHTEGKLPIIGVGGIFTAADAWEKIAAGASLVQVYTGLVYEGPSIAGDVVRGLKTRMEKEGVRSLNELRA